MMANGANNQHQANNQNTEMGVDPELLWQAADKIGQKKTLDWTQRETVRADMRRTVKRLLAKYGYPPDAQKAATELVLRQAELMAESVEV